MSQKEIYIRDQSLLDQLPVFYQPWWLDAVSTRWDVIIIYKDEKAVLVWPYTLEKKWMLQLIRTPRLTSNLGPYFLDNPVDNTLLEQAYRLLPKAGYHILTPPFSKDLSVFFEGKGYTAFHKRTYLIDLKPELAEISAAVDKKRMKLIQKAEKELLVVATQLNVPLFNQWLSGTFARQGNKYALTPELIAAVDQAARQHHACLCLEVRDASGNILGIQWFLYDRTSMYYMLSAINPELKHPSAAALLLWKAICTAKELGLEYFDFEGSSIPGIEFFFKSFGGLRVDYPVYSRTRSMIWKWKQKILG
ncbi:GNAT family N-acetyltransferase [Edaphocola aurantiacus]|uniref:GNAT family N-acetyltransferase n=1 Tax=Edaphocola aurantiacus TaxID=2601682 RepID=UPI001C9867F0|nr:GNAT family N-acetyltransferase [Edaphocola aurantiacus]